MKLYWGKGDNNKMLLLAEPAVKVASIDKVGPSRFVLRCLGRELVITHVDLACAKDECLLFTKACINELLEGLREL